MYTSTEPVPRIRTARVYRYDLSLRRPLPGRADRGRSGLLLRIEDEDGAVGWGEAAPLPGFSPESLEEAACQLRKVAEHLEASSPPAEEVSVSPVAEGPGPVPSVRWALDQALWTLLARRHDLAPPALAGATAGTSVPVNRLLEARGPAGLRTEAADAVRTGYRALKLKIGRVGQREELARVRAVAETVGTDAELRLDANRGFSLEEADRFLSELRQLPIAYLEEPLADPADLPALAERHGVPLALDETTREISPGELAASGASVVVLKPTLLGGFGPTRAFVEAAHAHDADAVVTSSFESDLGHRLLGWLVLALGLEDRPAGLDTRRWIEGELLRASSRIEGGRIEGLRRTDLDAAVLSEHLRPLR